MICSISCATKTITKTERVYVPPPPQYLHTYPVPALAGDQNRDLLSWAVDMREIILQQNKDKRSLQQWRAGIPGATNKENDK